MRDGESPPSLSSDVMEVSAEMTPSRAEQDIMVIGEAAEALCGVADFGCRLKLLSSQSAVELSDALSSDGPIVGARLAAPPVPLGGTQDRLDALTLPGLAACNAPSQVAESASQDASDAAAAEEVAHGLNKVDIAPADKALRDALHSSTVTCSDCSHRVANQSCAASMS